jgi:hypothetical protein
MLVVAAAVFFYYYYCHHHHHHHSLLASSDVAVPDSVSKTEKGPAGRPVDIDSKLTSELKTQEHSILEKGLVSSEVIKIVCSVHCVGI